MDPDTSAYLDDLAEICRRTTAVRTPGPLESLELDDRGMHILSGAFLGLYERFDPRDRDRLRMFAIVARSCVDALRMLRGIAHRNAGEEGLYRLCTAYLFVFRQRGVEIEGSFRPPQHSLH